MPILLCYTVPWYSQERRGEDARTKAFAAANKVNAALFSFNSKGACENCQGLGVVYVDLTFLESVKLPCEVCEGRRFKDEVLAYKLGD